MVDGCDDPLRRATWHYWTGFLHSLTGGRPEVVIEHCRVAADLASAAGLDEIGAIATSCLAQIYIFVGRLKEAVEAGERALEIFESRGNFWWASRTFWHLSVAANGLGEWDASLDYCRRALDHGVALDDLRLKAVGWLRMGSAHIQRGDLPSGLECCDNALALAPIPYDAAMARAARGYAKIKAGRTRRRYCGIERSSRLVRKFQAALHPPAPIFVAGGGSSSSGRPREGRTLD